MAKKMSEEKEREFEELSVFLEFYATHYLKIERDNERHASNVLAEIISKYGKSKVLQGLKQAINDILEETQRLNLNQIAEIDQVLLSKGILSLSALKRRYWSKYNKIINRGKIKNETEYYLICGVFSSIGESLSEGEVKLLNSLISEFESIKIKNNC